VRRLVVLLLLVGLALVAHPAAASAEKGPKLRVDLKSGKHRISPLIYGVNSADAGFAKKVRLPVNR
jgi:hypothetical protein